jgi:hypothetical protein
MGNMRVIKNSILSPKTIATLLLFSNVFACAGWVYWVFPDDDVLAIIFFFPISIVITGGGYAIGNLLFSIIGNFSPKVKEWKLLGALIIGLTAMIVYWIWFFSKGYV